MTIKTPLLTVDCVIFLSKSVLLIERKNPPFQGGLALPGGFVDIGETVESACLRELYEETNLKLEYRDITLVGIYSKPDRDPREHAVSVAYYATINNTDNLIAGDDALSVRFIDNWNREHLAFDHKTIVNDAFNMSING